MSMAKMNWNAMHTEANMTLTVCLLIDGYRDFAAGSL